MFHLKSKPRPPSDGGFDTPPHAVRLFSHGERAWALFVDDGVDAAQELDGLDILTATVRIRQPFTLFSAVIQIQHGGHGVHAQAIEMELLQPIERIGGQEFLTSLRPKLKISVPQSGVLAAPGIFVLVERGAVEPAQ